MKHDTLKKLTGYFLLISISFSINAQPVYRDEITSYNSINKQTQTINQITLSTGLENDYFLNERKEGHFYAEVKTSENYRNVTYNQAPLNLSIVIDRSGSMSGEKIKNAKQAAKHLIDQLDDEDYVSIVIYDNAVSVLQPTTRIMNRQMIKNKINNIVDGGGTNLMGGALKGYEEVRKSYKSGYINRVLLLSDGQANEGITNPREIERIVRKQASENGITISTFGLGNDYNEDLMTAMAESGNGNYYFINNSYDIASIFEKELNGISNAVAREVELKIILPENVSVQKVYGYRYTQKNQTVTVFMNTLFANDTRGILVRYNRTNYSTSNMQFTSSLAFTSMEGERKQRITLYNPCSYTNNRRLFNSSYNEWVSAQVALYESNEQLEMAMKEADKGNYENARQLVKKNKVYMQSKAPLVQKSVELQKAETVNESYDNSLQNAEAMPAAEMKVLQKATKADNYGIRNKKK
jgi:Ca-activated chloride channel homolog